MSKVVIIGCGFVGMSYAYSLLNQKTKVDELVLIDIDKKKAMGEVMDLNHGIAFSPTKLYIKCGDYSDCNNADITCICAGKNQEVGETRLDLVKKNYIVFKSIINEINKTNFKGIYLIATNPVDIMTLITKKLSKFPSNRVIGSGTMLDTSRLRYLVGKRLSLNPKNIHAYVIGEHGDSEFVSWSNAMIGVNNIEKFLSSKELNEISEEVKNAAYEIIDKKGVTCYGIGMCLTRITNAILDNEASILSVSTYSTKHDLYYGMPSIINRNGIVSSVDIDLSEEEIKKLNNSIEILSKIKNDLDI